MEEINNGGIASRDPFYEHLTSDQAQQAELLGRPERQYVEAIHRERTGEFSPAQKGNIEVLNLIEERFPHAIDIIYSGGERVFVLRRLANGGENINKRLSFLTKNGLFEVYLADSWTKDPFRPNPEYIDLVSISDFFGDAPSDPSAHDNCTFKDLSGKNFIIDERYKRDGHKLVARRVLFGKESSVHDDPQTFMKDLERINKEWAESDKRREDLALVAGGGLKPLLGLLNNDGGSESA